MIKCWRSLLMAAALNGTVCAGIAAAQTVAVTNAPAGAKVDVQVVQRSGVSLGNGTADATGIVSIPMNLQGKLTPAGMDANILIEACGTTRRILIVERGAQIPVVGEDCTRRDISGLYWVRPVNTLVVNASEPVATALLIKGEYTPHPDTGAPPVQQRRPSPTGLAFYGGGGLLSFSNATTRACGNVGACSGDQSGIGYSVGGVYWITRFLGLEGGYIRPPKAKSTADAAPLHFSTTQDVDVVRVAGDLGIPIGPVRLYGLVGGSYHQATTSDSETLDPVTVTVDGVQQTVPGGTQTFGLRTQGWSWALGGGIEVWTSNRFAIYGELGVSKLKGKATGGSEGRFDDRVSTLTAGLRLRLGRR